jgi:hypothetical protein
MSVHQFQGEFSKEGQPGEATLWVLLRLACVASACAPVAACVVALAAGRVAALPREAMIHATYAFLGLPSARACRADVSSRLIPGDAGAGEENSAPAGGVGLPIGGQLPVADQHARPGTPA